MGKVVWTLAALFVALQAWTWGGLFFPPTCSAPPCVSPAHSLQERYELRLYRSRGALRQVSLGALRDEDMFFKREGVRLDAGGWQQKVQVPLFARTRLNGSLAVVAVLLPESGGSFPAASAVITRHLVATRREGSFLLSGESEGAQPPRNVPVTHWPSSLVLRVVADHRSYDLRSPPPDIPLVRPRGSDKYTAFAFVDKLHLTRKHYGPLSSNTSRAHPSIMLKFRPVSVGVYRMLRQLEGSMAAMRGMGLTETETDEVVELMNPDRLYRLAVTFAISILHMVFSWLAFKNEVTFFRGKKGTQGLSKRTIIGQFACEVIIFLYLLDNDTSMLILGTAGVSALIQAWKVTKVIGARSKAEQATDAHDSMGMRYVSYALVPMLVAWAVYSLLYHEHTGYYSWLISSLSNAVYAFGFLLMLPQVWINYRLKTTAYLPWRVLIYKFFNTFVDDVLAFWILDMPMKHRLMTLRDDLVFFVYIYQRYIYPEDKSRPNEFGFAGEAVKED